MIKPSKILCVTPWFPSYPEDRDGSYILGSVNALVDMGHQLNILVARPWRPKWARFFHLDFKTKKINQTHFLNRFTLNVCDYLSFPRYYLGVFSNWFHVKKVTPIIIKLAKQYHCDIIHVHTQLNALAAVKAGKKLGLPVVVSLHGVTPNVRYWKSLAKFNDVLARADRVVLVGDSLRPFFTKVTQRTDHFRVVFNGFRTDKSLFTFSRAPWPHILRLASVSNLHEGKGIDINLEALAHLNRAGFMQWNYTIVGAGRERPSLESQVNRLKLNQQVKFVGECPHNEVFHYLQEADIFLLPSYREAFGVAYLEAMAAGLLTIGVIGQGPSAFIEHNKTGLLVRPNDSMSVVETLKEVFKSPAHMQKIALAGKVLVFQHFTWECHAKKLTAVFHELIKQHSILP